MKPNLEHIQFEILTYLKKQFCQSKDARTTLSIQSDLRDELCLDSLDIVELIMYLEKKYQIEFEGEELPPLNQVNDLARHTQELILRF